MSLRTRIRIISVAGAHSRVGKTSLCSLLLKALNGYGAIKFTKDLFGSSLIDDNKIILQKGKDTALMASSGAEKVILVSGQGERLKNALEKAITMMRHLTGVVVEGNSPVEFLTPDILIFVIGPDRQIKPPALDILKQADIVVINSAEGTDRDTSFISEKLQPKTKIFFINLREEGGKVGQLLSYIKRQLSEI
jgi:molybdopterin-guanine dinucleotide biosynthesis protein